MFRFYHQVTSIRSFWQGWLKKRIPKSRQTQLDQKRIFILPSRQGLLFLTIAVVIFVGGINYANSLILAVSFLMISLFLIGILHTYANLSGLIIRVGKSQNGFVGEGAFFEIVISRANHSRKKHQALNLSWQINNAPSATSVDLITESSCAQWLSLKAEHRGVLQPPRLKVESQYPLGLLTAWTSLQMDQQCLVYPKPISAELHQVNTTDHAGEASQIIVGQNDFDGLRRYTAGDNPRNIAWKQYAKGAGLHSKAFVDYAEKDIVLDWDALGGLDTEKRLSALCYWVLEFSKANRPFALRLPGVEIAQASSDVHLKQCLEQLALFGHTDKAHDHE